MLLCMAIVFLTLSLCLSGSLASCKPGSCPAKEIVGNRLVQKSHGVRRVSLTAEVAPALRADFGQSGCKCIGIDWPAGTIEINVGEKSVSYPSNIGSSCQPWDYSRHPDCLVNDPPSWCQRSYCFVDGCSCNLTALPKLTTYLPNSTYKGRRVYYSYATCGDVDEWSAENYANSCVNQKTEGQCALLGCTWTVRQQCVGSELAGSDAFCGHSEAREPTLGKSQCECIGFSNFPGTLQVSIGGITGGITAAYPASVGSSCGAWDEKFHPQCTGLGSSPSWCKQRWCYVDPCSCNTSTAPKKLTYVEGATFQGKPLFYSYSTCGEPDDYTGAENAAACPNHLTASRCWTATNCIWTADGGCIHEDFASICGAVPVPAPARDVPPRLPDPPQAPLPSAPPVITTKAPLPIDNWSAPPGTAAPAHHHHSHRDSGTGHHHASTTAPAHDHHHAPGRNAAVGRSPLLSAAAAAAVVAMGVVR